MRYRSTTVRNRSTPYAQSSPDPPGSRHLVELQPAPLDRSALLGRFSGDPLDHSHPNPPPLRGREAPRGLFATHPLLIPHHESQARRLVRAVVPGGVVLRKLGPQADGGDHERREVEEPVLEHVPKDQADKAKAQLEAAGATVEVK